MVSWIWFASARSASSRGTSRKRAARNARMFAVWDTIAVPTRTNGGAYGSAPDAFPSRMRVIALMPPRSLAMSTYRAPALDRRPVEELNPRRALRHLEAPSIDGGWTVSDVRPEHKAGNPRWPGRTPPATLTRGVRRPAAGGAWRRVRRGDARRLGPATCHAARAVARQLARERRDLDSGDPRRRRSLWCVRVH